jgi:hypothetical protein
VHDTRLYQQIQEIQGISPSLIRAAGRAVAAQGLAGHEAAKAAVIAQAEEIKDRLATNFLLMVAAVRQTDPLGVIDEAQVISRHPALQQRVKERMKQIAPRLGRSAEAVFSDLGQLAVVLAPIGFDKQTPLARVPRLLAAIGRFRAAAMKWAHDNADDSGAALAAAISHVTITCAEVTLADARVSTEATTELLKEWINAPEAVARRLARTEWLVDGWEDICVLWESATTKAARRAALLEISSLVPILPKEVNGWLSRQVDTEVTRRMPKIIRVNIDWRTGMYFDRVTRNEHRLVLAA